MMPKTTLESPTDCSICLESVLNNDHGLVLKTNCGHHFHRDCILLWMERCPRLPPQCPMCRRNVQDPRFRHRVRAVLKRLKVIGKRVLIVLIVVPFLLPLCCGAALFQLWRINTEYNLNRRRAHYRRS